MQNTAKQNYPSSVAFYDTRLGKDEDLIYNTPGYTDNQQNIKHVHSDMTSIARRKFHYIQRMKQNETSLQHTNTVFNSRKVGKIKIQKRSKFRSFLSKKYQQK